MPDIFGRTEHDYTHIRMLKERGQWERHQEAQARLRPNALPRHDFRALGAGFPEALARQETNAQAVGFLTNNLLAIQSMADEILYTDHRLPEFVPFNTMIPEGAETYGVRVNDYAAEGDYITEEGTDVPNATATQRLVPHALDLAGIDAAYSVEALRNAAFGGFPLSEESIRAGLRGAQNHMEKVGLVGHAGKGYRGLTALATTGAEAVTQTTRGANMSFTDIQGEDVRDLINAEIGALIESTDEVIGRVLNMGMAVYLPVAQYNYIVSKRIGDSLETTIMRSVTMDNPFTARTGNPVTFHSLIELKGAGAAISGSASDRMIVTVKDTKVFEMGVSIMPRVLRIMDKGREICALIEYKFSSLFVKRPSFIRYVDGV